MNLTIHACEKNLYGYLFHMLEFSESVRQPANHDKANCTIDVSEIWNDQNSSKISSMFWTGKCIYAYLTPLIIILGITGNVLSLSVFLSRNMRSLSASTYLAALALSDILTLLVYVQVEWLKRGLGYLSPGIDLSLLDTDGFCHVQLYVSYVSRFVSTWLLVAFTLERYIGVCHPLRRRYICRTTGTRRLVGAVLATSVTITLYKPLLSGVYVGGNGVHYCTRNPKHALVSSILDGIFGLLITFCPLVIITVLNTCIMRKLYLLKFLPLARTVKHHVTGIKLEFTVMLLGISFCFVAFNVPYFIVWSLFALRSPYFDTSVEQSFDVDIEYWQGILDITRTVFYMNYCCNILLYSVSGSYFRRQLKRLYCPCHKNHTRNLHDNSGPLNKMSNIWNQSWL